MTCRLLNNLCKQFGPSSGQTEQWSRICHLFKKSLKSLKKYSTSLLTIKPRQPHRSCTINIIFLKCILYMAVDFLTNFPHSGKTANRETAILLPIQSETLCSLLHVCRLSRHLSDSTYPGFSLNGLCSKIWYAFTLLKLLVIRIAMSE